MSSEKSDIEPSPSELLGDEMPVTRIGNVIEPDYDASTLEPCAIPLKQAVRDSAFPIPGLSNPGASHQQLGNFRLIREIGRGGMGMVYEAFEESLQRRVALKILPLAALMDSQQIRRFQNEAAAAAQLNHPNIVPVYSVGVDRGVHFYAMRMIDGQDISNVIRSIRRRLEERKSGGMSDATPAAKGTTANVNAHQPSPSDRIPFEKLSAIGRDLTPDAYAAATTSRKESVVADKVFQAVASLGRSVASALHHAHEQGVIHRDIKPSNLLLENNGQVWITDFGLAIVKDSPGETRTGEFVGTLRYMSPEQASGRRCLVDHRTDIFSLGASLYELATLRPAFDGKGRDEIIRQVSFAAPVSPRLINPRIPKSLEIIILKCMSKNPQDRYATASELADDLGCIIDGKPIKAKKPSLVARVRQWAQTHSTAAAIVGVVGITTCLLSAASSAVIYPLLRSEKAEKEKAVSLLELATGRLLIANSREVLPNNPGLALALAIEGANLSPGRESNVALQAAMESSHEKMLVSTGKTWPSTVDLSPDGSSAVVTGVSKKYDDQNIPATMYDLESGNLIATLEMEKSVTSAAFSNTGRFLLTASSSLAQGLDPISTLESASYSPPVLWNAATGKQLLSFSSSQLPIAGAAGFSPNDELLVLPGPDRNATVFSTSSGEAQWVLREHSAAVLQAAFSPDGSQIATLDLNGNIRIWDAKRAQVQLEIPGSALPGRLDAISFSVNPAHLVVSLTDGSRVYSLLNAQSLFHIPDSNIQISARGRKIASYFSGGKKVAIRDVATGTVECVVQAESQLGSVSLSSDGKMMAVADGSRVFVYETTSGSRLFELSGHDGIVRSVNFSADDQSVVTVAHDETLRSWSIDVAGKIDEKASSDLRSATTPSFDASGDRILIGSTLNMVVNLCDQDGQPLEGQAFGRLTHEYCDVQQLCLVDSNEVSVTDSLSSRVLRRRQFPSSNIRKVIPIPGTQRCVVMQNGGATICWDFSTDTIIELASKDTTVTDCRVSPDQAFVAIATADGVCFVWETSTWKLVRTLKHSVPVSSIGFLPDGKRIFTVSQQKVLSIWSDDEESPSVQLQDEGIKFDVAYATSDGQSIVTARELGMGFVVCWDVTTGKPQARMECEGGIRIGIHPEERMVLIFSLSKGLRLWDLNSATPLSLSPLPCTKAAFMGDKVVANQFSPSTDFRINQLLLQPNASVAAFGIFDTKTGKQTATVASSGSSASGDFSIDLKAQKIVVADTKYSSVSASLDHQNTPTRYGNHHHAICFSKFLPNNTNVLTASWDGQACLWGPDARLLRKFEANCGPVTTACIDSAGTRLVCGYYDGTVIDWNIGTGAELRRCSEAKAPVRSVQLDSNGSVLFLSGDGDVRYWNVVLESVASIIAESRLHSVCVASDGQVVAMIPDLARNQREADGPPTGLIWNPKTNQSSTIHGTGSVTAGQFANKGRLFAIVYDDGTTQILDVAEDSTIKVRDQFTTDEYDYTAVCFSPDDSLLCLGHEKGVTLLDAATGRQIHQLFVPKGQLIRFATESNSIPWTPFSNTGDKICVNTGSVFWWNVNPLQSAKAFSRRVLTPKERKRYGLETAESPQVDADAGGTKH